MNRIERFRFRNNQGQWLSARLDRPAGPIRAYALFAHCFTCSKSIRAASRISRELTGHALAVLRFDFTGLGSSEGKFENTNFSSNVSDLVCAADHMRDELAAPALLIGHSLGGAAVLAAARFIPEVRGVCTLGAPADPAHVTHLFEAAKEEIEAHGVATVELGGRPFKVRQQLLDDLSAQKLATHVSELGRPLLVFHAPHDQVVGIQNAARIYAAAKHPKSFVSLDTADHLLTRDVDSAYAATVLAAWADRYLDPQTELPPLDEGVVEVAETGFGKFLNSVRVGSHAAVADEPRSVGGDDAGPTPYDYLLAALGACTSMTIRMYADRKQIPLEHVAVHLQHEKVHAKDLAEVDGATGYVDHIRRDIRIEGDIDAKTRARMMQIADRCPVHRTLHSEVLVSTREIE